MTITRDAIWNIASETGFAAMGIIAPEHAVTLPGRKARELPFEPRSVIVLAAPTFRWADQSGNADTVTDAAGMVVDAASVTVDAASITADISGYYFASNEIHHKSVAFMTKLREAGQDSGLRVEPLPTTRAKTSALYAGLGVYRMNTLLYTSYSGSYTSIQVFAISQYLDRDQPSDCGNPERANLAESCKDCRRCADACPTGALNGEGGIDIGKCLRRHMLSGQPVPVEYRRLMDRRLVGCEICQAVCPMEPCTVPVRRREDIRRYTVGELLVSPPETIEALACDIGGNYAKAVRVQAQAAIIAGNICLGEYLPALELMAGAEDEAVREHAVWAAERIRYGCPE